MGKAAAITGYTASQVVLSDTGGAREVLRVLRKVLVAMAAIMPLAVITLMIAMVMAMVMRTHEI